MVSSGRKPRKSRSLRRTVGIRPTRKTVLVFCEGTKTEPYYLKALQQERAVQEVASVEIQVDMKASGAVPLTLVAAAAEARARSPRSQGDVDEVWCLFDVEWPRNHPNLHEAIDRARAGGVELAISNPCFELWLALHFEDQTAWLDTDDAIRLRRGRDKSSGKRLDGTMYMVHRAGAAQRARSLTARHAQNGTAFPDDNPSSGMYRFLSAVEPDS